MSQATVGSELKTMFRDPPAECRPLQIVHELATLPAMVGVQDGAGSADDGKEAGVADELRRANEAAPVDKRRLTRGLQALKDLGLGGLVTNVSFKNYLQDEQAWRVLVAGVESAGELGLRVWIYDEEGYPSGAAGRHVLAGHPELEAQELVHEPGSAEPFRVRPSFEGTHAANNYYAVKRYPNLLDARVGARFVEVTYDAYAARLGGEGLARVEAFFTDEPSLMACSLGQIPEQARAKVPVADPPDPAAKLLPAVPWADDLPARYRERFGDDLLPRRADLFGGDGPEACETRRRFWSLVADLLADRYFGTLRRWCEAHGTASSGHCLAEEDLVRHPALCGNILRLLQQMHVPGIDVLSSDPGRLLTSSQYLLTAGYAASAALLNGTRRVMTETSDHSERMAGKNVGLAEMLATAAWQYATGVTEFTLYYSPKLHGEFYRAYCDGVGQMGALLRDAERVVPVGLYYPIRDAWTHYRPTAENLTAKTQPARLQAIARSYAEAARGLWAAGVPFCFVDHDHLAAGVVRSGGLRVGKAAFSALAFSDVDQLPVEAQKTVDRFEKEGGKVLRLNSAEALASEEVRALAPFRVKWDGAGCLVAPFRRPGLGLALVVNTTGEPRRGVCSQAFPAGGTRWAIGSGEVAAIPASSEPVVLSLAPLEVLVLSWPLGAEERDR